MRKNILVVVSLTLALLLGLMGAAAQQMPDPSVTVVDQLSLDGTVSIASVYSAGQGFIVIHADNGSGAPGPVIGYAPVSTGWTYNLPVSIDPTLATPTLFAMLHTDDHTVGTYEFGTVDGADGPVRVNDAVVTPPFNVNLVAASDQFVDAGRVTIGTVVAQQAGWLVVHADNNGAPGPVLGETLVDAGLNADVQVDLSGDATAMLWPMLHVDTGAAGTYEFGTVDGADGPVSVDGQVATFPIWTVPHMRVADQIVLHGDNYAMMGEAMAPTLTAASVLSEGPGWLVVHADNNGAPGPVLGETLVEAGLNTEVAVELSGDVTPVLWPMLHVDSGEAGVYEFGTVDGADGPVQVDGNVLTFAIQAAPSITYAGSFDGTTLTVEQATIDAPGWLVIHADNNGAPGAVLGETPLHPGVNRNVTVDLMVDAAPSQVFPMLHYDTGEAGVYEFGTVEGADGPVMVGGNVVVGPLSPGM